MNTFTIRQYCVADEIIIMMAMTMMLLKMMMTMMMMKMMGMTRIVP